MHIAAVITAAGNSIRFGTGRKKEFEILNGRPVLYSSVKPFIQDPQINTIIITHAKGTEVQMRGCLEDLSLEKVLFIEGGTTRQASVLNALDFLSQKVNPDYVLIHDGARPFIQKLLIDAILTETVKTGAAVPGLPLTDALKVVNNGFIAGHNNRNHFCTVQTPQGFDFHILYDCHQKAKTLQEEFFDDAQVYALSGRSIAIVDGDKNNKKITFQSDLGGLS